MAYADFIVDPVGGSNLSAGSPTGSIYPVTSTNGAYTQGGGAGGTDRFTASSGTPFSGISAADVTAGLVFVSIYTDAAAAPTGFVGRVTAFTSTTLDISLTAISGTRPTTVGSGRTAVVGGAWKGPTGVSGFPFGFITAALTDVAGDVPRVNGKGTSNITAAMTHSTAAPVVFQGMTATPGDGGKWTIDGGTSGASYTLLTLGAGNVECLDIVFQNNGATGSADGVNSSSASNLWSRCTFANLRGSGLVTSTNNQLVRECEAYNCNQSNTASKYGFAGTGVTYFRRCIAHDNVGSNSGGFLVSIVGSLDGCIADSNGKDGFTVLPSVAAWVASCDAYNNGGNGITLTPVGTCSVVIESCNLVKNGGFGVQGSGVSVRHGVVRNCGFGSGTQANSSGTTNSLGALQELGSITYPADVTPWVDPANGDFRINLAAAKGTGRGLFTQTQPGYAGAVGFPDVGAAQHLEAIPTASDLRSGVVVGNVTGTLVVPTAANVRLGTVYDTTTGTLALPATLDVRLGVGYGAGGTEFTGALFVSTSDILVLTGSGANAPTLAGRESGFFLPQSIGCVFGEAVTIAVIMETPPAGGAGTWTMGFWIKKAQGLLPPAPVVTKASGSGIVTLDATAGVFAIVLDSADTKQAPGTYFFDFWRVDAGGETMVAQGKFSIGDTTRP